MHAVEQSTAPPERPSAWEARFERIANREKYLARAQLEKIFETGQGELESRNSAGQRVIYSLRDLVIHFLDHLDDHAVGLQFAANLNAKANTRQAAMTALEPVLDEFLDHHSRAMAYAEMDISSREGNPWTT